MVPDSRDSEDNLVNMHACLGDLVAEAGGVSRDGGRAGELAELSLSDKRRMARHLRCGLAVGLRRHNSRGDHRLVVGGLGHNGHICQVRQSRATVISTTVTNLPRQQ